MSRIATATFSLVLLTSALPVSAAFASEALEEALGGPYVTCTGAIAWTTRGDVAATRVEPMRLAVRDAEDAGAIALYLSVDDFVADDVWTCSDGLCTATRTLPTSMTTNVLRLRHQVDLGSGEAIYDMEAVFMVIGAGAEALEVEGTTGKGAFICEQALPAGVIASSQ